MMQVVWVARHSHIGDAFFDRDAADYLLSELKTGWITPDIQVRLIQQIDAALVDEQGQQTHSPLSQLLSSSP